MGRDVYDVLIAWTPAIYATGLVLTALHGVYEIFLGNGAQGSAELIGSGGLLTQTKKVKRWSDSQLKTYRKKRKLETVSKAYGTTLKELDEVLDGDDGILDNLIREEPNKFRFTDDGMLCGE